MKTFFKSSICILMLFLSACDDNSDAKSESTSISPAAIEFRFVKPELEPSEEIKKNEPVSNTEESLTLDQLATPEFDYKEIKECADHQSVEKIRQSRANGKPLIISTHPGSNPGPKKLQDPRYRLNDPDYSRDNMGKDISTLMVDRHRALTADRRIPAILENSINSQIPGPFIAIVDSHVFGTNGRAPLFPKGTRIICEYESLVRVGDTRLPASCSRAIRPDGAEVVLTGAIAADQIGKIGLVGMVDNRNFERYAGAFGVSLISAATAGVVSLDDSTFAKTAAIGAALSAGQLSAKILDENIDIQPIMTIAAGSRILIIPKTDVWLRKPELIQADEEETNQETNEKIYQENDKQHKKGVKK